MSKLTVVVLVIAVTVGVRSQDVYYHDFDPPYPPGFVQSVEAAAASRGVKIQMITGVWRGEIPGAHYYNAVAIPDSQLLCMIQFVREVVSGGGEGPIKNFQIRCHKPRIIINK